jgi:hypothetical protein
MKTTKTGPRSMRIVATLMSLLFAGSICLGELEPVGRKAGVIQFDAMNELNMEELGYTSAVWFVRYWVCRSSTPPP